MLVPRRPSLATFVLLALVGCNESTLGSSDKSPSVAIITPLDGAAFDPSGPVTFCAQLDDEDRIDELEILVQGSVDGTLWVSDGATPETCAGGNLGLSLTLTGSAQTLGISVIDTGGQAAEAQVRIVPAVNTLPWCEIDAPIDGSSYLTSDDIPFVARAGDGETDAASLDAVLQSDVDGVLWTGAPDSGGDIVTSGLALTGGAHLLTLTVTDARGAVDVCGVHVEVDPCLDADGDGASTCDDDCDDNDATAFPGGVEVADGADNDCNGVADDQTNLYDDDADGWTELDGDCDDTDATIRPDGTEIWYDGVDQDCDGEDDDQDRDGFVRAEDCDDENAAVNPVAVEVWYDGVDDDCDGNDDDQDVDGYVVADDCDDLAATINPSRTEVWYDGVDQDCDGRDDDQDSDGYLLADDCADTDATVNPGVAEVWYDGTDQDCDGNDIDQDGDGLAYTADCDDTDAAVNTGEAEIWYDDIDQNCDGNDDDQDGDGYEVDVDCDDTSVYAYPGAPEVWYDGIDQDCAGGDDDDQDGDGSVYGDDCDDTDAGRYPLATEVWYDGVDQDCDGNDTDQDTDGYPYTVDCDDVDATANPGGVEVWYNGIDEDCDGSDDDQDEDGYALVDDCDDLDDRVNPGEPETWYDGVDDDCDGNDDDQDGDGWALADDCDDTSVLVNDAALEIRDGVDNDCNSLCDEGVMTAGELVITEIMKDPTGAILDTSGEWFEVYNASTIAITMCGWTIADDDGETFDMTSDVEVLPGHYALFMRSGSTSSNGGLTADYAYGSSLQLGNSGDEIVLMNDGTEIDRVNYTTSFPSSAGYSLTLDPLSLDGTSNDTAGNWCAGSSSYYASNYGTPGATNDSCP
ncbi:MAG: MopE-related protein [Pseudomonadota bacterium]|nr:MopE-related protein [Pseudomonadota bacterium]